MFSASLSPYLCDCFLSAHVCADTGNRGVQISGVVMLFRYPPRTALAVGLGMAQIGEFAFVLLSSASQLGLLPYQVYMLLMGAPPPPPSFPPICLTIRASFSIAAALFVHLYLHTYLRN